MTAHKTNEFSGREISKVAAKTAFQSTGSRFILGMKEAIFDSPNEKKERMTRIANALETYGVSLASSKVNPQFDLESAKKSLREFVSELTPEERTRFDALIKKGVYRKSRLAIEIYAVVSA